MLKDIFTDLTQTEDKEVFKDALLAFVSLMIFLFLMLLILGGSIFILIYDVSGNGTVEGLAPVGILAALTA